MIDDKGSFYGVYRACRDAAWRCQLEFGVCRLPVKVTGIARRAGIHIVRNSDVSELRGGELAVSICDAGEWTIIYDDTLDMYMVRFVTAHELGHIFLGHDYKVQEKRFAFTGRKISLEREADMFAMRLLAPAFVLHELGAVRAEDIQTICGIRSFRLPTGQGEWRCLKNAAASTRVRWSARFTNVSSRISTL